LRAGIKVVLSINHIRESSSIPRYLRDIYYPANINSTVANKTPILGSSPLISLSGGYSFFFIKLFLAGERRAEAEAAAALA